jgi:hypothetical protein
MPVVDLFVENLREYGPTYRFRSRFIPESDRLLGFLVCADMQLAVKTFTKVHESHAVHMKVVSAPGASGSGRDECDNYEGDQPGDKCGGDCPERW